MGEIARTCTETDPRVDTFWKREDLVTQMANQSNKAEFSVILSPLIIPLHQT